MCSGKEAVVMHRQPVTELRLNSECAKFDAGFEIVPCRVIDGERERPMLCQVHFDGNIGGSQSPTKRVGFQMQVMRPFLRFGSDGFHCHYGVGHDFYDINDRFWFDNRRVG